MGGRKINRIERSFSNVRKDILSIKKRVNTAQDKLKDVNLKLSDVTSKEEFYNFIRELNEEFRKLEKHIATQDGLDRLRQTLKTQISDLESEILARKVINRFSQAIDTSSMPARTTQKFLSCYSSHRQRAANITRSRHHEYRR